MPESNEPRVRYVAPWVADWKKRRDAGTAVLAGIGLFLVLIGTGEWSWWRVLFIAFFAIMWGIAIFVALRSSFSDGWSAGREWEYRRTMGGGR